MNLKLPKTKPIRKPNLYLGFTPAKQASPIRLAMNLRVPLRLTLVSISPFSRFSINLLQIKFRNCNQILFQPPSHCYQRN